MKVVKKVFNPTRFSARMEDRQPVMVDLTAGSCRWWRLTTEAAGDPGGLRRCWDRELSAFPIGLLSAWAVAGLSVRFWFFYFRPIHVWARIWNLGGVHILDN